MKNNFTEARFGCEILNSDVSVHEANFSIFKFTVMPKHHFKGNKTDTNPQGLKIIFDFLNFKIIKIGQQLVDSQNV